MEVLVGLGRIRTLNLYICNVHATVSTSPTALLTPRSTCAHFPQIIFCRRKSPATAKLRSRYTKILSEFPKQQNLKLVHVHMMLEPSTVSFVLSGPDLAIYLLLLSQTNALHALFFHLFGILLIRFRQSIDNEKALHSSCINGYKVINILFSQMHR